VTRRQAPAPARAEVTAPAKLNLGLRVVGRRADGYHELRSLFVPLDWADELAVEVDDAPEASVELALAGPESGIPAGASNLAVRAAARFLEGAGLRARVRIALTKRLPAAAGLGGGSSDAGAVLRALAALFPDALSGPRLAQVALGVGADVPFFLDPRPARVSGVGERIEALAGVPRMAVLLANPGIPLSTADVFRAYDALSGDPPSLTIPGPDPTLGADSGPLEESASLSVAALARRLHNDLEAAAVRLCPPIARLQERIRRAGALGVGMSGSGATVFGLFEDEAGAAAAQAALAVEASSAPGSGSAAGPQRGSRSFSRVAWTLESR